MKNTTLYYDPEEHMFWVLGHGYVVPENPADWRGYSLDCGFALSPQNTDYEFKAVDPPTPVKREPVTARGALLMGLLLFGTTKENIGRAKTLVVHPSFLFRLFLDQTVDISMVQEYLPVNDHSIRLKPLTLRGFQIHGMNNPTFDLVVNSELICNAGLFDEAGEAMAAI